MDRSPNLRGAKETACCVKADRSELVQIVRIQNHLMDFLRDCVAFTVHFLESASAPSECPTLGCCCEGSSLGVGRRMGRWSGGVVGVYITTCSWYMAHFHALNLA